MFPKNVGFILGFHMVPKWLQASSDLHPPKSQVHLKKTRRLNVTGSNGRTCSALSSHDGGLIGQVQVTPSASEMEVQGALPEVAKAGSGRESPGGKRGTHRSSGSELWAAELANAHFTH